MKILSLWLLLASALAAAPAPWTERLTPDRPAGLPPLAPTELRYSLSWRGLVEAGEVTFRFGKREAAFPNHYVASARGRSKGFAARLFPYRFTFTSLLEPGSRLPVRSHASERDADETAITTAAFSRRGVHIEKVETDLATGTRRTRIRELRHPGTLDLFSALLHVRNQTLAPGETVVFVTCPVGRGFLVTVRVLGREVLHGHPAIRLGVAMQRIEDDLSLKPYTKLKSATLWLSDDVHRIPLELRTRVFIGDVRMSLTAWEVER